MPFRLGWCGVYLDFLERTNIPLGKLGGDLGNSRIWQSEHRLGMVVMHCALYVVAIWIDEQGQRGRSDQCLFCCGL